MWDKLVKGLKSFPNAVLTGLDEDGYPFSIRCTPRLDPAAQVLHIQLSKGIEIQPGPAGLLCHSHDEKLWNLKSFGVQGRLEQHQDGWIFRPLRTIPGAGMNGLLGEMQSLLKARQTAKHYLEKRGLKRPNVDWKGIKTLRAQVKKNDDSAN